MRDMYFCENRDIADDNKKVLFRIIGYAAESQVVHEQVDMLLQETQEFADLAGVSAAQVRSELITVSARYKRMRVFFVSDFKDTLPKDTLELGKDWTMWKWLGN